MWATNLHFLNLFVTETSGSKNQTDGEASWKPFAPTQGTIGIDDDDQLITYLICFFILHG
jgi:hypothetical protein